MQGKGEKMTRGYESVCDIILEDLEIELEQIAEDEIGCSKDELKWLLGKELGINVAIRIVKQFAFTGGAKT